METEIRSDGTTPAYWGLLAEDGVDEIVASVLDAADVEILEELGGGPVGAAGPAGDAARAEAERAVLLRQLLDDVLRRYLRRQRRQAGREAGR